MRPYSIDIDNNVVTAHIQWSLFAIIILFSANLVMFGGRVKPDGIPPLLHVDQDLSPALVFPLLQVELEVEELFGREDITWQTGREDRGC